MGGSILFPWDKDRERVARACPSSMATRVGRAQVEKASYLPLSKGQESVLEGFLPVGFQTHHHFLRELHSEKERELSFCDRRTELSLKAHSDRFGLCAAAGIWEARRGFVLGNTALWACDLYILSCSFGVRALTSFITQMTYFNLPDTRSAMGF